MAKGKSKSRFFSCFRTHSSDSSDVMSSDGRTHASTSYTGSHTSDILTGALTQQMLALQQQLLEHRQLIAQLQQGHGLNHFHQQKQEGPGSCLNEDWHDAVSMFSSDAGSFADQQLRQPQPVSRPTVLACVTEHEEAAACQKAQLLPAQIQLKGAHWIPNPPLLFAEPNLQFVPVPARTGFEGFWEVDPQLTTPHPQPIDIMIKANMLVRKVHKMIVGVLIAETDTTLTVAGQPGFIPPGFPAAYIENYDKTGLLTSWTPRRDIRLGSCSGRIYMSACGKLVLRMESKPAFSKQADYVCEDYITLEQGGQMLVDHMCCYEIATGRRATQIQMCRLRPHGHGK